MDSIAEVDQIVEVLKRLPADKLQEVKKYVLTLDHSKCHAANGKDQSFGQVLAEMKRTSFQPPPGTPSVIDLIREDRDR